MGGRFLSSWSSSKSNGQSRALRPDDASAVARPRPFVQKRSLIRDVPYKGTAGLATAWQVESDAPAFFGFTRRREAEEAGQTCFRFLLPGIDTRII